MRNSSSESRIRQIGEEIFQRAESATPSVFTPAFWQQWAMNWMTGDEDLKLRLFRFIEALPSLRSSESIARHLMEYVGPRLEQSNGVAHPPLPSLLQLALAYRRPDSLLAAVVACAAQFGCSRSAERFICGATAPEAIASVRRLRRKGMTFTLDVLGETVIADSVARAHQELYVHLIHQLSDVASQWDAVPLIDQAPWGSLPRVNISIKLSAIVAKLDPIDPAGAMTTVLERLRPILRVARDRGAFINVDMEHYAVKDLTLEIYKHVLMDREFRDWPDCGIVVQAYMPEADEDMHRLIDWTRQRGTPITVRLVKGAYWDSETAAAIRNGWPIPLYTEKWQSDAAYERIARRILENSDIIHPAFASHNVRTIAAVLAMQEELGLPPRTLELQMLTGMGDPLKHAVVAMNQRLRVYSPFGDLMTGMAYLIRRLIENTANESFLRQSFGQQASVEFLLRNPLDPTVHVPSRLPASGIEDIDAENKSFVKEPTVDFSRAENREAIQKALAEVRGQFGREYLPVIANKEVKSARWHESRNPSRPDEIVGRVAIGDSGLADQAVSAARAAADAWAKTSPTDRADILDRAADILRQRRFEIAAWIVYEVGKTWREAQAECKDTIDYLRYYAHELRRHADSSRRHNSSNKHNEYFDAPRGIVLVLSPYCFPTSLLTGMSSAALAAGNTVIAKPAIEGSVCAAKIVSAFIEAGLPSGVLNFVSGHGEEVGDYLVRHSGIDMIAYSGSSQIGRKISEAAAKTRTAQQAFKYVVADVGRKNAVIVDDDADLDHAVQAVLTSAFGYAGQKHTACSRVVVLNEVYKVFIDKLVDAARGIKPAVADLPGTTVGPLINGEAVAAAERFMAMGKGEARCVLESPTSSSDTNGYFMSPVIFVDVPPDARIAQEEIMAPVLCVIGADTFEQAIDIVRRHPHAVCGSVYSRSPSHIALAQNRLSSGDDFKIGSLDYLRQFTLPRIMSEQPARQGPMTTGSKGKTKRSTSVH